LKILQALLLILLIPFYIVANDDRPPIKYNYLTKKEVSSFINMMVNKYHFKRTYMNAVLKSAKLDRDTLARYTGKFRKNTTIGTWERFKLHVVNPKTFKEARTFKKRYQHTLKKAEKFVSFHNSFWKYHLSKIVNHEGVSIGFEVKPLYIPFVYGFSDIVDVYYWLKGDGKVKVVIKLDSNLVERIHFPGSDAPSSGGE